MRITHTELPPDTLKELARNRKSGPAELDSSRLAPNSALKPSLSPPDNSVNSHRIPSKPACLWLSWPSP